MLTRLRALGARLRAAFGRRDDDRDFEDELRSHLAMLIEDHVRRGMPLDEARRAASIRLGAVTALKERYREVQGLPLVDTVRQDIRHGLRALRRDAGLATFVILIVGIGVGASSTVFGTVHALLLRPLPFADPDRLVWIRNDTGAGLSGETVQVGHVLDFRERAGSFVDVAGYMAFYGAGDRTLTGAGEPERLTEVPVSGNFFSLLGIRPALGRLFTADESQWNGPRAVLLSHQIWTRRFASDPAIVGRSITLNQDAVSVVGVLPASFDFGAVFAPGTRVDLYAPFPLGPETNGWGNTTSLVGRLRPDATLSRAQAEASAIGGRLMREHPGRNRFRPVLSTLRDRVSGPVRSAVWLLAAAVGMVMFIVCANLSNLLLARSTSRQREMAIRAALGAGRRRQMQQVLTESLMLSSGGAVVGLLLTIAGTRFLAQLEAINIPLLAAVRLDATVLAFALAIATLTGVAIGLMPAFRVSALAPHRVLNDSARGTSEGPAHGWTRRVLVVSEIALACMLLAGAGLLLRSFTRVLDVDLGFQPESAVAIRIDPDARYATQDHRNAYFDDTLQRIRALPGVDAAGLTDTLPLGRNRSWGVSIPGKVFPPNDGPNAFVRVVSDGYVAAMGIPLIAGRDFAPTDTSSSAPVVVVNDTFARRMWPGEDPVGKTLRTDRPERRVVGVVRDVRHLALERDAGLEIYLPIRQTNDYPSVELVVRGSRSASDLASLIGSALTAVDAGRPVRDFRTLQALVDRSVSPRRFLVVLLGAFAGFALILAALGIYGVIWYAVKQRRQEIGIRLALGASPRGLQAGILLQTLRLVAAGVTIGFIAAWILGRLIRGLLFEVTPWDWATYAAVVVVLAIVAALAGYLPARQATRIDPLKALRAD